MDPVTATGVALAVVGVTAQCLVGTLHAIQLISSAKNFRKEYQYLKVMLRLEQQRCYNWAEVSGLLAYIDAEGNIEADLESKLMRLNHNAVLQTILLMQSLAESYIKIQGKYDPDGIHRLSEKPPNILPSDQQDREEEDTGQQTLPEVISFLERTRNRVSHSSLLKGIRWASFDKSKLDILVERLRKLNDALLDLVDYNIRAEIYENTLETRLSVLQLNTKVDDLCTLLKAALSYSDETRKDFHDPVIENFYRTQSMMPLPNQSSESKWNSEAYLAGLTRFKIINESIERSEDISSDIENELQIAELKTQIERVELSRRQISVITEHQGTDRPKTSEGTYSGSRQSPLQDVWIEWKYYNPNIKLRGPDPQLRNRVENLAKLLRASLRSTYFRIPTFLGFFDDASPAPHESVSDSDSTTDEPDSEGLYRFGFVFEKPEQPDTNKSQKVFSLHDIIKSRPLPSLTRRISLAKKISQSLLFLHSVDWLHKGLRSSSIIFFGTDLSDCDLTEPMLSGFDYSRPSSIGEKTERPIGAPEDNYYRHPDAHRAGEDEEGQTFRRTFDIYSLGVILVEIACWKSVDDLLGIEKPRTSATRKIREKLICDNTYVDAVEAGAGESFRNATSICLTGATALGLNEKDNELDVSSSIKVLRNFHERVVRALESIKI